MKPILIYSHPKEPITQVLLSSFFCEKRGGLAISIEKFIAKVDVYDEFDESSVRICWHDRDSGTKIYNTHEYYLINRILSLPEACFNNFSSTDRAFVAAEYKSYFLFAMQSFPFCFVKPGPFGLSGNRFSLPRQWDMVKHAKLKNRVCVPNFYLGNILLCDLKKNIVYSDPNNFYFWKPNKEVQKKYCFAFERPTGLPVIGSVIGDEINIFCYHSNDFIEEEKTAKISNILKELMKVFDCSNMLEFLIFVDSEKVSFGMMNTLLFASKNKAWFIDCVISFFDKEMKIKI